MLVCNVSLRPRRVGIAADVVEAAAALDDLGSGSGQVVFATLVDDPASVRDFVDAYLGEIMLEAASADATADAGLAYAAAIVEVATADAAQDAFIGVALVARSAMVMGTFVNSPGTSREAYIDSIMINL